MRPSAVPAVLATALLTAAAAPAPPPQSAAASAELPTVLVPAPDPDALWAEDRATPGLPLRYGVRIPVDVDPAVGGAYSLAPDGAPRWEVVLRSPGAASLGFELADVRIPEGAAFRLRALDGSTGRTVAGPEDVAPDGRLQLPPFPGDAVVLEYRHPAGSAALPGFRVETLIHDYRDVFALERELALAFGSCTVGADCPEGAPFATQARAVVRTLSGGTLCTGTLINNTAQDGTPYVLTAWHCGQDSTTLFRFGYVDGDCGAIPAPQDLEASGATVLAADQASDGRLLRVEGALPAGHDAFFAGWNRSAEGLLEGYSLGHADGGPLALAIAAQGATPVTLPIGGIGVLPCFRAQWSLGAAVDGFSGAPLFDQSDRVRGVTSGAPALACPGEAYFGRFGSFFGNAGLATWLDPLGLGVESLHGLDPLDPGSAIPPGAFQVDSSEPAALAVVDPDQPTTLRLLGVGLEDVDTIRVNGTPLDGFPPQYTLVNDFELDLLLATPLPVGTLDVELEAAGQLASIQVPVEYNAAPTLDLANSDPEFLLSFQGITLTLGGQPGDIAGLYASTSPLPTSVPGVVDLAIGDGGTNLVAFGGFVIPASGHVQLSAGFSGIATGTKLYFQALWIPVAAPTFPLATTNVEVGTVLF